mgnify:CR=1 FL=1
MPTYYFTIKTMKIYQLHKKQNLPITIDEAWDFLSSPENLKTITPDYMGFNILSGADRPMFAGQIIQYIVTPVLGIKTKWVTEITHVINKHTTFIIIKYKCYIFKSTAICC